MTDDWPLVLIDVDGVLNPSFPSAVRSHLWFHEGWVQRSKIEVHGRPARLFVNPAHGRWLRALSAEMEAEIAWGTTWADYANIHVGPLLGLPRLRYAPVPWPLPRDHEAEAKAAAIVPWTAGRPFVWLDGEPGAAQAAAELAGDQPHLVVPVDEHEGLREGHIEQARLWLKQYQ